MKQKLDVLIVARPDHSMQIYNALLKQNKLSFKFLSFKIFPQWVKKITGIKRMTTVTSNALCSWKLTFVNLCRYKFRFSFAQSWDETRCFDVQLKRILKKNDVGIIHYWPEYGDDVIREYLQLHPETHFFADIHMPHPVVVYESMLPIYKKFGIDPQTTKLYTMSREENHLVDNATDILVPSSYVADTYREVYSDKKYHVVSYGISVSPNYEKRKRTIIKEFVYAGRISLEKGSDLLLDYFLNHPLLNIHLYGSIIPGQERIFERYKIANNIIFHGSVPKTELQEYIKMCDVGIHLSRFDAYSLAVGEMIGSGLPVIVSSQTGNRDDVKKYGFGEVVSLDDKSIENCIEKVCNLRNYNIYAENIDKYIQSTALLKYSDNMLDFYETILKK